MKSSWNDETKSEIIQSIDKIVKKMKEESRDSFRKI